MTGKTIWAIGVCVGLGICAAVYFALISTGAYRPPQATKASIEALAGQARADLVFIRGGEFQMGDFEIEIERLDGTTFRTFIAGTPPAPAHLVRLNSYYLSRHEVSNAQFDLFTAATNRTADVPKGRNLRRTGDYAAVTSWDQAEAYCRWLGEISGVAMGLPTEAQWEFAARSRGLNVAFGTNTGMLLPNVNINKSGWILPMKIGSFPPNPLGLYDLAGSQDEWVADWFDPNYYAVSPIENPQGPATGTHRGRRGHNDLWTLGAATTVTRNIDPNTSVEGKTPVTAGIRCAVNDPQAPEQSGFGQVAGTVPNGYPQRYSLKPLAQDWQPENMGYETAPAVIEAQADGL